MFCLFGVCFVVIVIVCFDSRRDHCLFVWSIETNAWFLIFFILKTFDKKNRSRMLHKWCICRWSSWLSVGEINSIHNFRSKYHYIFVQSLNFWMKLVLVWWISTMKFECFLNVYWILIWKCSMEFWKCFMESNNISMVA